MSTASLPRLSAEELQSLYPVSAWRPAAHLCAVILGIGLAIAIAQVSGSALAWLAAAIFVGALQHHLSILNHEANHFLLFRRRSVNEAARALTAWSTGFRLDYREVHARHHRSLGAADDPDLPNYLHYPVSPRDFAVDVGWHLSGLAAAAQFLEQARAANGSASAPAASTVEWLGLLGVQAGIAGAIFLSTGSLLAYVLLFALPLATVAKSLTHFRNVAEHTRRLGVADAALSRHRTILCHPVEAFFFAPLHFHYHAEHHLYPGIPYHRLRDAHALLLAKPGYAEAIDVERGFVRFLLRRGVRRSGGATPSLASPGAAP